MAAENIRAAAERADVAGHQKQVAVSAHIGRADRVLRAAHAPDEGRGTLLGECLSNLLDLSARNAGDALNFFRIPLCDFGADEIHADDALPEAEKRFLAVNAEFFGPEVTGWGSPNGADARHTTDRDHPLVAAWPRR
jgi:hypothetical protein